MASTGAIEQFEGATIQSISLSRDEGKPDALWLTCTLKDGSSRDLSAYTLPDEDMLFIRVDGMFVPPEELP